MCFGPILRRELIKRAAASSKRSELIPPIFITVDLLLKNDDGSQWVI